MAITHVATAVINDTSVAADAHLEPEFNIFSDFAGVCFYLEISESTFSPGGPHGALCKNSKQKSRGKQAKNSLSAAIVNVACRAGGHDL